MTPEDLVRLITVRNHITLVVNTLYRGIDKAKLRELEAKRTQLDKLFVDEMVNFDLSEFGVVDSQPKAPASKAGTKNTTDAVVFTPGGVKAAPSSEMADVTLDPVPVEAMRASKPARPSKPKATKKTAKKATTKRATAKKSKAKILDAPEDQTLIQKRLAEKKASM